MRNWNWKYILIGLGVGGAMMLHPFTRMIVLFILPLGRGLDDLLMWILILGFVLVGLARGYQDWSKRKDFIFVDRHKNYKVKQSIIGLISVLIIAFTPAGRLLYRGFFFGEPVEITHPDFFIPIVASVAVAVIGWSVLHFVFKPKRRKAREE